LIEKLWIFFIILNEDCRRPRKFETTESARRSRNDGFWAEQEKHEDLTDNFVSQTPLI